MASSPSIIDAAKAETKKPSKMKTLTKKYGAVGIIVYVAIGCIDLGITLGVIQLVGLDKVKALERAVLDTLFRAKDKFGSNTNATASNETALDSMVEKRKEKDDNSTPSFASIFILAYGIHKTLLLPVRLGITAAITPAVVRKIHQLGWARYFPGLKNLSKPHQTPTSTIK
ncbi:hypothetical protein BDF20DRAFT_823723 [Mycotypha africana]|uniref:uncharacterized protein n=1 Tax=Mycotypha africana TaxID=64632 RepID=UPI0023014DC8|nr:uncharacterized protein BDF20DRAFT_823723 [Mycotypha africana]KAI8973369.1 hypothetical protein BDF20DRAFT_823723 [Mycotypha africana]